MEAKGCIWIGTTEFLYANQSYIDLDNIHLTVAGHAAMDSYLYSILNPLGIFN